MLGTIVVAEPPLMKMAHNKRLRQPFRPARGKRNDALWISTRDIYWLKHLANHEGNEEASFKVRIQNIRINIYYGFRVLSYLILDVQGYRAF